VDDQERDYFRKLVHDLERAKRRWQLLAFILFAGFVCFIVVGMGSLVVFGFRSQRIQMIEARMQAEQAEAQAREAAVQAERAQAALERLREVEAKAKELQPPSEKGKQARDKNE
jgi:F0F1-type ATP synthase membrane subunit b/b'